MNRCSMAFGVVIFGFAALLVGCAGTTWQHIQVPPGYQPPKEVTVALVVQANGEHLAEAVEELHRALADQFASEGIHATFVPGVEAMPSTELSVVEWDQGVRALRWLGFGGEGHIVVVVKSAAGSGQPGLDGQVRGYVRSGWFGGNSYNSAVEAGQTIAKTIATGRP